MKTKLLKLVNKSRFTNGSQNSFLDRTIPIFEKIIEKVPIDNDRPEEVSLFGLNDLKSQLVTTLTNLKVDFEEFRTIMKTPRKLTETEQSVKLLMLLITNLGGFKKVIYISKLNNPENEDYITLWNIVRVYKNMSRKKQETCIGEINKFITEMKKETHKEVLEELKLIESLTVLENNYANLQKVISKKNNKELNITYNTAESRQKCWASFDVLYMNTLSFVTLYQNEELNILIEELNGSIQKANNDNYKKTKPKEENDRPDEV